MRISFGLFIVVKMILQQITLQGWVLQQPLGSLVRGVHEILRFKTCSKSRKAIFNPFEGDIDSSEDESSEIVNNGGTDSSSTDNGEHHGSNGVTNGVNGSSTDSEEEVEENELEKHEVVTNGNRFTEDGEPEFKPKKVGSALPVSFYHGGKALLGKTGTWFYYQWLFFL